jgi:hypothetical protein
MVIISSIAALGATVATTLGFGTVGIAAQLAIGIGTQVVLGAAMRALAPKPKLPSTQPRGYTVNQRGSALDHQIIYGRARVGGAIVFTSTTGTNNKFLHQVVAYAGHEIQEFDEIYINDARVTGISGSGNVTQVTLPDGSTSDRYNGYIRIKQKLGSPTQTAVADLVSEVPEWTDEHRLRGIAYLYIRYAFDADVFPNGVPEVTTTIKGKKVYDPRTDTTVWSDNPALCLRDYLTSDYGLGEAAANIDDTLVIAAANVCDQTDTIAGTARYTCNGNFTTGQTPDDIIGDLLTSMSGLLWYAQGEWRMKPGYWVAPTVEFTEDDLRSNVFVNTRHSRRDNFNTIRGTFRGDETDWQLTDYPEVTNAAFLSADNGQESVADIELPFTDNSIEARRIARIMLERNRQQLAVGASFGLRAFQVQVGDVVQLSLTRFGWSQKEFEVVGWTFGLAEGLDLQVRMTLREISESVFDEIDDGVVYERDNTTLLSPFDVPDVGLSAEADIQISNQKVSNIAAVTVSTSRPEAVDHVQLEYKKSSDSDYTSFGSGQLGKFLIRDLEVANYDFRARAVNTFGIRGQFAAIENVEINAFAGDPSDVGAITKELSGGTLFLSWPAVPDADLSHYEVKHNSNTTGATWSNSSTIIEKVGRPSTSATVPARSGTFLIRAYDKEGNFSENPTSIVVLPSELPQLGTSQDLTESPTFSGTKTNLVVSSGKLLIDNTSASSPVGEYLFSTYIDTGTVRNARVTGERTFTRAYDGATLRWDDVPQLIDTWPGLFDTWTDETADFGDVSTLVYVSATDDDPAGSPTWSQYEPANGSFYQGRAFRFKAILSSENSNYTPSVSALKVTVEY